jgi:hypothetical protein
MCVTLVCTLQVKPVASPFSSSYERSTKAKNTPDSNLVDCETEELKLGDSLERGEMKTQRIRTKQQQNLWQLTFELTKEPHEQPVEKEYQRDDERIGPGAFI